MPMTTLGVLLLAAQAVNPYTLDIGFPGKYAAPLGYSEPKTGEVVKLDQIVEAAKGVRFVLVGESHTSPEHHKAQADIIAAFVKSGRKVVVGFEMFTRDNQPNINDWHKGEQKEADFIEQSKWKTQWGFDFAIYRPIFEVAKKEGLQLVALNIPRDWVRQVGKEGVGALSEEQRKWVPDPYLLSKEHREVFTALIGGHPLAGERGENMYAAQVSWDEGMATSALDFMEDNFKADKDAIMVIVVGSGHVMYGQGINYRITRKTKEKTVSVVCLDSAEPLEVAKGIADFLFVAPPPKGT